MIEPFSYELPFDRIAQRPVQPYDLARMMLVQIGQAQLADSSFRGLPDFVRPGDRFVFNNTQVIPARLYGRLTTSGGQVELLLVRKEVSGHWTCLGKPLKKLKPGMCIELPQGIQAQVVQNLVEQVLIEFRSVSGDLVPDDLLFEVGNMPIPPYIRKGFSDTDDMKDYQSPFAKELGSIAAPTASLHFTQELLSALKAMGCSISFLTLHLSVSSFQPLWQPGENFDPSLSAPGEEKLLCPSKIVEEIFETRRQGGRIIAVGTSVVRALESIANGVGETSGPEISVSTQLFIQPGFKFHYVDAIITNFHQPRTTHLLLVEAFVGRELLSHVYARALTGGYRFLSYGDGMLLLP